MRIRIAGVVVALGVALALPAGAQAQGCSQTDPTHVYCTADLGGGQSVTLDCKVLLSEPQGGGRNDTTGCAVRLNDSHLDCGSLVHTGSGGRFERLGCEVRSGPDYSECAYRSVSSAGGQSQVIRCGPVEVPLSATAKRAATKKSLKARRRAKRR